MPFTESGSPWSNGFEGDQEIDLDRLHWGDLSNIKDDVKSDLWFNVQRRKLH